jgi:sorbose reductase
MIGSVDHLLCFAGVVGCQHAIDMTAAEWRRTLDINTTGSFLCAQACAKNMIQQGRGGSIIFVASISGHRVNYPRNQAISLPPYPELPVSLVRGLRHTPGPFSFKGTCC